MQKIYCLLFAVLFAQASYAASCVSVKQVSANYATKQVTFDVVWSTCTGTHNYKTWVIVDYRTVNANGTKGAWTRATVSGTSVGTLVSASKGVWVTGSASKTQRVTFTLSGMPAQFDWCANALDYPPQAIMSNGTYTLKGTPPFTINGSTTLGANVKTYTGACVTSVTDATNNPEGIVTNPVFTAGAIASTGQALCSGSAYATIGSTTAAGGGDSRITYQWLRNGSVISGATATTYVPTQAGTYTRQAKDGTCNTAWVASTGSWVVTVVSIPAVPTVTNNGSKCAGTGITFTASASGVTGYEWTGSVTGTGTSKTTATTAGAYSAQARSYLTSSGTTCYSAYSTASASTIVAIPAVPTLTQNGPKCAGTAITFTSTAVSGATGYQWVGAGVTASSGTARTTSSKATTAGSYLAQVRSCTTASGITCYSAYTANVTGVINSYPSVSVTGSSSVSVNNTITLTGSPTGGSWSTSNSSRATVSGGIVTGKSAGAATITYTVTKNGCPANAAKAITILNAVPVSGCNNSNYTLGTIGFASTKTWTVGTQTWSDAVTATYCQKTTYNAANSSPYNSDCRTNPSYSGDLFSWCMVAAYTAQLCPSPWRVPTSSDFVTLDIALGGSGNSRSDDVATIAKYLNASIWGGSWFGGCLYNGALDGQGTWLDMWSSTSYNSSLSYRLGMTTSYYQIIPAGATTRDYGLPLRCVKN